MFHKVKEIFQKLFPSNSVQQYEAPYKIEPKIEPLTRPVLHTEVEIQPSISNEPQQDVKVEEIVSVVEKPLKVGTPKKPKINSNGTRSKSRKSK